MSSGASLLLPPPRLLLRLFEAVEDAVVEGDEPEADSRAGRTVFHEILSVQRELERILSKALHQVGEDDETGAMARDLTKKLGELYVKTPDQLRQALDEPEARTRVESLRLRLRLRLS